MAKKKTKKLSPAEEAVRARLEAILGVPVVQLDDNSADGMPDLQLVHPDRPAAPVEVTRAVDEQEEKATRDKGFEPWNTTTLSASWTLVSDGPPPIWKKLRPEAEGLLGQLEQAGIDGFIPATEMTYRVRAAATQAEPELSIWRALHRLGQLSVHQGHAFPREHGPHTIGVGLGHGGTRGMTADPVAPWATEFVNDPVRRDNVRKLDRGGAESHLAIEVELTGVGFAVWSGVGDPDRLEFVPTPEPELPETITDLWLAVSFASGDVLHWRRGSAWTRHRLRDPQ